MLFHLLASVYAEGRRGSVISVFLSIQLNGQEKAEARRGSLSCSGSELTRRSQAQVPLTCYSCLGGRAREPPGVPFHRAQPFRDKLMHLLPLEGLPLSHFSETIRVGWVVVTPCACRRWCPRVHGSSSASPAGEVALLVARFLCSHCGYQGCTSGPARPVQAGSGQSLCPSPPSSSTQGWVGGVGVDSGGGWVGRGTSRVQDSASLLGNKGNDGTYCMALSGRFSKQLRGSTRVTHTRFHPSHQSSVLSNERFTSDYLEQV